MRIFGFSATAAFSLLSLSTAIAAKAPELPEELVLSGQNIIDVELEGKPIKLEVRPDGAGIVTVNPAIAAEQQFKPGMFGARVAVGKELVTGSTAVHRVNFGIEPQKQRIMWTDHQSSTIADGVISPASLPYKRVVFQLNQPVAGEKIYRFPMDNFGFLGRGGMGTTVEAMDEKIRVIFSLVRNENMVSAPTGNWFAENFQGAFTGAPKSTLVFYGIERPTRAMTLKQPFAISDLSVSEIAVRVSDYGDATGIADANAAPAPGGDSEEIVVTGKRDKKVDLRLSVGRGVLGKCSTLTYDLDKREIRMSCAL
jgi:hypothetical protein